MRMSRFFGRTLRQAPSGAEAASHQLLERAGFIRQIAAGIFAYLPLARRALHRIEAIVREEIEAIGGQEITMPVVHPADIWQQTGRWYEIGAELGRFQDRAGREMVLGMTHEEIVAYLARREIRSHQDLPLLVYQIQTKWRDEARPRAGLIRVREFDMKDSYSLDADEAGLDRQYRAHYHAYFNIFRRCGLDVLAVASDVGMMGGTAAHEFMVLADIGEDTIIRCAACGYAANRQIAVFEKPSPPSEEPRPLKRVATPEVTTIDALTAFLEIPPARTAKAIFRVATLREGEAAREQFVFAVVRGDMDLNETKLANAVQAAELRPATEEEIRAVGAEPGYGSPLGVREALVVVDEAVVASPNLVAGANESGYHLLNVNVGRDYEPDLVTDIAVAEAGYPCPHCGAPLRADRAVEVGNIFKLGTRYTEALDCTFKDAQGEAHPIVMGSYGIGIGRLLACIAEVHRDDEGLIWPVTVAPYAVHLCALFRDREEETFRVAEELYARLQEVGIDVLYDDREASAGVKFTDADLIGLPLRITVGSRSLKRGGVELKRRDRAERRLVSSEAAVEEARATLEALEAEIAAWVGEDPPSLAV
ncbi:MAG: proline--tRNA ligase [Anaerolineae bacterium]